MQTAGRAGATSTPPGKSVPLAARLFALALLFIIIVAPTTADPDLWGHVLFGRDIVAARSVPATDPYSFSSDRRWINHEWLAEVLMYLSYRAGGAAGLVFLKGVVVCATLGCVVAGLRRWRFRPLHHDALILVALAGTWTRYHPVRPQLFSLLLFALLLLILQEAEREGPRRLIWTVPVFAAWANLHGGFLVGLAALAVWGIVRVVRVRREWPGVLVFGCAAGAATLVTPYGLELWRFLRETVGASRPEISDWQPALSAGPLVLIPWTIVVLTAGLALWRGRRTGIPISAVAIVATLALGSLRIGRIDAFLALSVVMLLGPCFGKPKEAAGGETRWSTVAWACALALVIAGAAALSPRGSCIGMPNYPEAEATAFLQDRQGRLLTLFDWGQYAIWHFGGRLKVSMDGRRETVYSEALSDAHFRLYFGEEGSIALVRQLAPDFIWLPAGSPAIAMLEREGWRAVFKGPVSAVLANRDQGPTQIVDQVSAEPRCFPER